LDWSCLSCCAFNKHSYIQSVINTNVGGSLPRTIWNIMETKDKNAFKLGTAALTFAVTSLLTWISFFFYFMQDEGQIDNEAFFLNALADSFLILRLPLHLIFWDIVKDNSFLFYVTLFLNPIFWSVLIERLIHWTKKIIKTSEA
jgi:hypothetical protein